MNKKVYILATVHQYDTNYYGTATPTVMIDVFTDFNMAKNVAISNANAQKKIEREGVISEWVHDEQACELARYYLPTFEFVKPLFMIETRSIFRERQVTTFRTVFEQVLN